MDKKIIGIDLGGMTIKFAILIIDGVVQQRWSIETNTSKDGKHTVPPITESIRHHIDLYNMKKEDFVGAGMGIPGSVDIEKGTAVGVCNLSWTIVQPAKEQIESVLGIPFALDNDANAAALGERWKGAGENNPDVIFITSGTGVGGGIIAAGELLYGVAGCAGEAGYVTIDPNGFDCTCEKRGCLEIVSSVTGAVRVARRLSEESAGDSELKQVTDSGRDVSSKDVFEFAEKGDHFALMVVDCVCFYLGLATGNSGNTLSPDSMAIGGGVSAVEEFLRSCAEKYSQEFTSPQARNSTKTKLAELGNEAGVIGAASLALQFSKEK